MGKLIVISGPSGVGKGTVVKAMMAKKDNLFFSVSATTRPPRPGEVDGKGLLLCGPGAFFESDPPGRNAGI